MNNNYRNTYYNQTNLILKKRQNYIIQLKYYQSMQQQIKIKPTNKEQPLRRQCLIKITLQNTLLANKYCIHKLIKRQKHIFQYLAMNIVDGRDYLIKFYRLNEIQDYDEMIKERYRIFKRMNIYRQIDSPYVIKCYEVYQNQSYIAAVYEYINSKSLEQQVSQNMIPKDNYQVILKHIYQGIDKIHSVGIKIKNLDLNKIYFKNGYYKITDFQLFLSEKQNKQGQKISIQQSNQIFRSQIENIQEKNKNIKIQYDDSWALGIFYLKLILGNKFNILVDFGTKQQSIYTQKICNQIGNKISKQSHCFLKQSLMLNYQNRIKWDQIRQLLFKKNNKQKLQDVDEFLTRTFLVNDNKQQNQSQYIQNFYSYTKRQYIQYINEQKQIENSNFYEIQRDLSIHKLDFINLTKQDIDIYMMDHANDEQKVYKQLSKNQFQAQKSKYLIQHILKPIQKHEVLNVIDNRPHIQFMYIISSRCFTNLSYINKYIATLTPHQKQQHGYIISEYKKNVQSVYKQSNKYFNKYADKLTECENCIKDKVFDRFKLMYNKQKAEKKNKFLNGIQGIDYTKQQHIQYTCQKYISKILTDIQQYVKQGDLQMGLASSIINILKKYKQICLLQDHNEIKGKQFQDCVNALFINKKSEGKKINIYSSLQVKKSKPQLDEYENKNDERMFTNLQWIKSDW